MLIIPVKDEENIEKALRKFKRKVEKTGVMRSLKSRKYFENLVTYPEISQKLIEKYGAGSSR